MPTLTPDSVALVTALISLAATVFQATPPTHRRAVGRRKPHTRRPTSPRRRIGAGRLRGRTQSR
jgi:hypothetical protein